MIGNGLRLGGVFDLEVWNPRSRSIAKAGVWNPEDYELIQVVEAPNGIVTQGINDMFDQYMRTGTGITPVIGLIGVTGYTEVLPADTMASHDGWVEDENYDEATRPAWGPNAPDSGTITNSVKVLFTMNASTNIRGLLTASDNEKGGTDGILWSTAVLPLVVSLQVAQVARAGYSLTGIGA